MKTIETTYQGHKYTTDGKNIWKDGVLLDIEVPTSVIGLRNIEALMADEHIYYQGKWYVPTPPL